MNLFLSWRVWDLQIDVKFNFQPFFWAVVTDHPNCFLFLIKLRRPINDYVKPQTRRQIAATPTSVCCVISQENYDYFWESDLFRNA